MKPALFFFTAALATTPCYGSEQYEILYENLERSTGLAEHLPTIGVAPERLAALMARGGTDAHFHLRCEDLRELLPPEQSYYTQVPGQNFWVHTGEGDLSDAIYLTMHTEKERIECVSLLLASLSSPIFFDLEWDGGGDLTQEYLRFLEGKNEDGSFRLTHLGLHIGAFKKLAETDKAQTLLSHKTRPL